MGTPASTTTATRMRAAAPRALVCSGCGATAAPPGPPFNWSLAVQDGQRTWTCGDCVRADLARIETGAAGW